MSVTSKGVAHVFGIEAGVGTITNATVVSFSIDEESANSTTVVNELGNVIERRYDDETVKGSITLKIKAAYTVASAASQITYDGVKYIIEKVGRAEQAGDYVVITYDIITSEYITLA